jgi:hypothetical protein
MVYAPALLKRFEQRSKHYELMRTILLEEFCVVPKGTPILCLPTQGLRPGLRYAAAPRLVFVAIRSAM